MCYYFINSHLCYARFKYQLLLRKTCLYIFGDQYSRNVVTVVAVRD